MSGLITTIEQNNSKLETLNNVFRTKLSGIGAQTSGNENYNDLVNLLDGISVGGGRQMLLVRGTVNRNASSMKATGAGWNLVTANYATSSTSKFPVLNGKLYFAHNGVNYPVFVFANINDGCSKNTSSVVQHITVNRYYLYTPQSPFSRIGYAKVNSSGSVVAASGRNAGNGLS